MKTNQDYHEEHDGFNIENSMAASTGFCYPNDEQSSERVFDVDNIDVVIRLATLLFAAPKPKMTLAAILYSAGVDVGIYLGCDNTETEISQQLGESKQNFSAAIKRIKAECGITHSNTGKKHSSKESYKKNNYRKVTHEEETN